MVMKWIEVLTGSLEQKKQFKEATGRIEALPDPHGTAARAMHRYLMRCGGITDGDTLAAMVTDLADLWERAAVDGTPLREIVGDDPAEFAESFAQAYTGRRWIDKERELLATAVSEAERAEPGPAETERPETER